MESLNNFIHSFMPCVPYKETFANRVDLADGLHYLNDAQGFLYKMVAIKLIRILSLGNGSVHRV